jgi:hypothetical protein
MRAWAVAVAIVSMTVTVAAYARSAPVPPPHYHSADDAIARSQGFWRLTHEAPERRVRADSVAFSCIDRVGSFSVVWLSLPGAPPRCGYSQRERRRGPTLGIYVQKAHDDMSLENVVADEIRRGGDARREMGERNVGRCRGVLMRTTIDPASGRYRNGREWRTHGRHDIVYVLERERHVVEVRLRSEGPAPYYERDAEVLRIAELTMPC